MEINFQNWFGDWKSSIELNSCCAARKDLRWYSRSENYVKRHLGIVVPLTCWRQQGELPTMSQKPFWLFWCNDSHSLSSSLLLLSDLCDRRSCCVTANQLMTKFVCISCCATLPWAAAVLSMGVNVPRIFVNVPNARIFATAAGIVGCQRERPVDGSRMLATAFLSKPSRGRERNLPPPLLPSHGMHSHNP